MTPAPLAYGGQQCPKCGRFFDAETDDAETCAPCSKFTEPTRLQLFARELRAERVARLMAEDQQLEVEEWTKAGWLIDESSFVAVNRRLAKRLTAHSLPHLLERLSTSDY